MESENAPKTLSRQTVDDTYVEPKQWNSGFWNTSGASWYTNRRPYRSVAFGTWKVGNASQLINRSASQGRQLTHAKSLDANRNYVLDSIGEKLEVGECGEKLLKDKTVTLSEISRSFVDQQQSLSSVVPSYIEKQLISAVQDISRSSSLNTKPTTVTSIPLDSHTNFESTTTVSSNKTAAKYCSIQRQLSDYMDAVTTSRRFISASSIDTINGSHILTDEHPTVVLDIKSGQQLNGFNEIQERSSLIFDKKKKLFFTMHRSHQRSRSVGNVTVYGIGNGPSTSNYDYCSNYGTVCGGSTAKDKASRFALSRSPSHRTHSSLNAIAATKRFLKMLYETATISNRVRNKNTSSTDVTEIGLTGTIYQAPKPFFEIRYSSDMDDSEPLDNDYNNVRLALHNEDCESTPSTMKSTDTDDSMNSSSLTKSGCSLESRRMSFSDFRSWNEIFEHLKKEIVAIRESDAKILADLRNVETQIQCVKKRSLSTPRSEYYPPVDISNQKLGDLVESIPL